MEANAFSRVTCFASQIIDPFSSIHHLVNIVLHNVHDVIHLLLNGVGSTRRMLFTATATTFTSFVSRNIRIVRFGPATANRLKRSTKYRNIGNGTYILD